MPTFQSLKTLVGKGRIATAYEVPLNATRRNYPGLKTRSYLLQVAIDANKHLNFTFHYTGAPEPPDMSADQPLDMRVYDQENIIEIVLDTSMIGWYFDTEASDTLMVGDLENRILPYPANAYYRDLTFVSPTAPETRCKKLWFHSTKCIDVDINGKPFVNRHPMTIRVMVDQYVGTVMKEPLCLYIDPGIKNPGDGPS